MTEIQEAPADEKPPLSVPFFRPSITEAEIEQVAECLRSGWLTTGPRVRAFEQRFAEFVGAKHAIAVTSCTAALHLAVEALNLHAGQGVLVPTLTFAATAEVVRYQGAVPILVDCDPVSLNMDFGDAERKLQAVGSGDIFQGIDPHTVGMIPVHVGGLMMDLGRIDAFARRHGLWVVEDAAHAVPAAYRAGPADHWRRCGGNTAAVSCFSFYSNKPMTTGEGGMATTDHDELAQRIRRMSLHGLSHDAWDRYSGNGSWDYRIVAPGFKYNLTDIAASLGLLQLERAEAMRHERQTLAENYMRDLASVDEIELPPRVPDRVHAWHLFPIRLRLNRLAVDRDAFLELLRRRGVACSVHWRPLHLHPYYQEAFGWKKEDFPVATAEWRRLISLPLFPGMREEEQAYVVLVLRDLCRRYGVRKIVTTGRPAHPR